MYRFNAGRTIHIKCTELGILFLLWGLLISPKPELLPDVAGQNRYFRWKEGSVHVPNCKSFLVTEAEKKHVRRRARFQQHGDASYRQVFFFCNPNEFLTRLATMDETWLYQYDKVRIGGVATYRLISPPLCPPARPRLTYRNPLMR